ncbi:MAG: lipopolysaccharide biosynthesis protein [Prevotella sp.]|nr:lipopolysaccharide biosynthesis protein [Prevotella sp.]
MAKSLKQKAASGIVWSALQKYSTMFIQFISGIVLARLLTPYDYGCIGMLLIFIVLAESFIDGGFGSALIQKKRPTQEDYSTIFFWNIAMAIILYAIIYFTAPYIAKFYKIPLLCSVLRVQAIILFIYAFNIVQRNQLQKTLNFKAISIVTITTSIIALIVTIILAYHGFGVWSLVAQYIITAAIPAMAFWFYLKWRPQWIFSWKSFKELFSFGFYMFLTHLLNQFGQQIQGLLIGKIYNPSTMGYYSKAHGVEKLASTSISRAMTEVTYPLYAEAQDDKAKMISMIKRLTSTLSFLTFPAMFILILLAKPIFVLLYSDRWLASVPYFQVLCLAGLPNCLHAVNLQTISAIGKSKTMFLWTVLKRTVGIITIIGGLFVFGMKGLLAGAVINSWFSYLVNIGLVSKHIGYKWTRQLMDLFPIAAVSALAAGISFGFGYLIKGSLYTNGLLMLMVYLLIYGTWAVVFKPDSYNYFLSIIPSKFCFWERKNKG